MPFARSAAVLFCATLSVYAVPSAPPAWMYRSLAGLSAADIDFVARSVGGSGAQPAPGPQSNTSTRLVNDAAHPFIPPQYGDQRGPCPGLNTLASHGYLPRNGIATPAQIVIAVQEGFNMDNDLAVLVTYAAFLVDGNPITNLMSIGSKTFGTGPDPPKPASVGGLDEHGTFEGDASLTRGDAFFGDNHSFNETLFDQLVSISNTVGGGKYNFAAAAELRFKRIQQSNATNPTFFMSYPRFATAFFEATFPYSFFVDGRVNDGQLDLNVARGFFQESRMPDGFFRRNGPYGIAIGGNDNATALLAVHPVPPGQNNGIGNWTTDLAAIAEEQSDCSGLYTAFIAQVKALYPNPKGALRDALNTNLKNFVSPLLALGEGCDLFQFP